MRTDILLVEDQAMVRHGLTALINTLDHYGVSKAVGSLPEALACLQRPHSFALILSDFHLDGGRRDAGHVAGAHRRDDTALGLLEKSRELQLPPVIVLTSVCNAAELQQAIQLGAKGLLYKECELTELTRAFDAVLAGGVYFASGLGLATALPAATTSQPNTATSTATTASVPVLTPAECEILQWLATGMSNKEIARLLGKSAETVKIQVSQLLRKLDCKTRTEAVVNASRRGLL